MTKRIILLGWALCLSLSTTFLTAAPAGLKTISPEHPEVLCELPGPSAVMVINPTQHTLTAAWPHVAGAARYKITAKDLNTNTVVYTAYMVANPVVPAQHLITGLVPNTPYEVGVSASACSFGENFGAPTNGYGQTDNIVIGDVIILSPCNPNTGGGNPFYGDDSEVTFEMTMDPNGANGEYSQSCLVVSGTRTSNNVNWQIQLNIAAAYCSTDKYKWIYKATNLQNIYSITTNQTGNELIVKSGTSNNNEEVLKIIGIDADNSEMAFTARILNCYNLGGSYRDPARGCGNTGLSRNPCTNGTQGKNAGPNNHGQVQIELESRSDFSNDLPATESITAIPNPFNDFTNVQYQISKQSPVSIMLFNAVGQAQRELLNDREVEPGTYTVPVDMNDLAPGVYFLTIQTASGRKITTVVKQ